MTSATDPDLRFQIHHFLNSVRFRLTLWFVAILGVILAIFSLFVYTRQVQILRTETVNRLAAESRQIEGYYHEVIGQKIEEEEDGSQSSGIIAGNAPLIQGDDVLAVIGSQGEILQSSGDLSTADLESVIRLWNSLKSPLTPIPYAPEKDQETYLFQITPMSIEDYWQGALVVGSPVDGTRQLPRLALTLFLGSALFLMLAFAGGYWLADRAMRPVQAITRTARQISDSDLSRRIKLNRDDELGELANTFDEMLDRLQAAFERQRQFTADASHELRTPLTIIGLEATRTLERTRNLEEYEQALGVIQSENDWMSRLVNELLTLARMDSGQLSLNKERIELSDLALDAVVRLTHLANASGVRLETGEMEEVFILGDRSYLNQMLTNLIENAIKYTQGESARVLVESGPGIFQDAPAGFIRVADNGPGIPAEHIPFLFERFYRIDEARYQDQEREISAASGTGLGLAIARSIAQALGGSIEVDSQVGEGAIFTTWFPSISTQP